MVWIFNRYFFPPAYFAVIHSQILTIYPRLDLCYLPVGHEPQLGCRPRRYVPISSWCFLWGRGLYCRPDAEKNLTANVDWFYCRAHPGSHRRPHHWLVLCQADSTLLRDATDFFRFLIWGNRFTVVQFYGGDDGIPGIPMPPLLSSSKNSYYFILIVLVICLMIMYMILNSPFGRTLQAIRDNPQRCEAIGINVRRHQLIAIVIATFFAGVAGVLFVVWSVRFLLTYCFGLCPLRSSS